jgi:hypothetical protein
MKSSGRTGRNLLHFQRIEHLRKLMTGAQYEGTVKSLQAHLEDRLARIQKQTLGQLAGQFVDDVLADAGERDAPENISEGWVRFGFTIRTDSAFVEQHTAEMKAIVDARNDLIHHFLSRFSPESDESTRAALACLDEQYANAQPMLDRLQDFAASLQKAAVDIERGPPRGQICLRFTRKQITWRERVREARSLPRET